MSEIQRYRVVAAGQADTQALKARDGQFVLYIDHLAQLRALEQRQAWQPISSAPKDGTEILGFWQLTGSPHFKIDCVRYWQTQGSWGSTDTPDELYGDPTNWMPLPPAPSAEGETCDMCKGLKFGWTNRDGDFVPQANCTGYCPACHGTGKQQKGGV